MVVQREQIEGKEVAIIVLSRKANPKSLEGDRQELLEKVRSLFSDWTVKAVQIGEI